MKSFFFNLYLLKDPKEYYIDALDLLISELKKQLDSHEHTLNTLLTYSAELENTEVYSSRKDRLQGKVDVAFEVVQAVVSPENEQQSNELDELRQRIENVTVKIMSMK